MVEETTTRPPFDGKPLPLDLKRCVGLLTLAPLRLVILTPLLILAWVSSRIGDHFQTIPKLCQCHVFWNISEMQVCWEWRRTSQWAVTGRSSKGLISLLPGKTPLHNSIIGSCLASFVVTIFCKSGSATNVQMQQKGWWWLWSLVAGQDWKAP